MMWGAGCGDGPWGLLWIGASWGLVALLVYGLVRASRGSSEGRSADEARRILAERFARGEVSGEGFERRRQVLEREAS